MPKVNCGLVRQTRGGCKSVKRWGTMVRGGMESKRTSGNDTWFHGKRIGVGQRGAKVLTAWHLDERRNAREERGLQTITGIWRMGRISPQGSEQRCCFRRNLRRDGDAGVVTKLTRESGKRGLIE